MCKYAKKKMKFFVVFSLSLFFKIQTIINMKINSFFSNSRTWNTNFLNLKFLFWLSFPRYVLCKLAFRLRLGNSLYLPISVILQTCIQTFFWRFFFPPNICNYASLHSNFFLENLCFRLQRHVILWACILDSFFVFPKFCNFASLQLDFFLEIFISFSKIDL